MAIEKRNCKDYSFLIDNGNEQYLFYDEAFFVTCQRKERSLPWNDKISSSLRDVHNAQLNIVVSLACLIMSLNDSTFLKQL